MILVVIRCHKHSGFRATIEPEERKEKEERERIKENDLR